MALGGTSLLKAQELSESTYASIRDHVLPKALEQRWRDIPWRSTLWGAIAEGRKMDRPILLWAMNGLFLMDCRRMV